MTERARRSWPGRRAMAGEEGATLALVAISLFWLVGMAALVIDVGDGWLGRQTMISATDAAALAAAQDLADRPGDETRACATARAYVVDNVATATDIRCVISRLGPDGGRVSIGASDELDAALLGPRREASVGSISTVAWGPPATVTALRPFALCYDGSAALRDLIDNPPSEPTRIEVSFLRDDPLDCGGSPDVGNFATVDFGRGTPMSKIRSWMLDGYPGQVAFDPATIFDCGVGATCHERPYASNDIRPELSVLRTRGTYMLFPVFNYGDADRVHLVGMVRARLDDYELDGVPESWRLELQVAPGLVAGTCCGPPELLAGNKVIAICGVDPEAYAGCEAALG